MRVVSAVLAFLYAIGLAGCGHSPLSSTVLAAAGVTNAVDGLFLDPSLQYMRVSTPKRTVLMVLGYTDVLPEGVMETWYSGEGEVLKLLNGRLVSSAGFPRDWRSVRFENLPSWGDMADKAHVQYVRTRDEMPGYRFGIRESLRLDSIAVPARTRLKGISASALIWYAETVTEGKQGMPTALYGIRRGNTAAPVVVYAEQCMTRDLCISWQSWPVSP